MTASTAIVWRWRDRFMVEVVHLDRMTPPGRLDPRRVMLWSARRGVFVLAATTRCDSGEIVAKDQG